MAQYSKPDSELGYIEDNAEIGYLKFNNLRHSVLGCMLGDFNDVGDYVVSPEIVKELIEMEKYIVQTYDNIELCKGVLKLDRQIAFMVTFEGNKATLSLIEKMNYEANFAINIGTYSNINEYVLDSVETSGEIDRNVVYDRWNISPFGGHVVDIFNCDDSVLEKYFGIVNRFKYLLEANKILLDQEEELEEIEASYTNEIFEILKRYPKFETVVLGTIKETLTEKKDAVSVKKPFFAKTFNEVLENAIEQNINVLDEKEKKQFEIEKHNSVRNLNIKREDAVKVELTRHNDFDGNEIAPKILTLKTSENNSSKSVVEHGEQFVASHKAVYDRIAQKQENAMLSEESEKDKLLTGLVAKGFADVVDIKIINKQTVQAEIKADSTNAAKSVTPQVKKPAPKKQEAKKPAAKKPAAKKPAAKKPAAKKQEAKKEKTDNNKAEETNVRLFARRLQGYTDSNVKPEETTVKKRKDHNAEVGMVKTIVLKENINAPKPVGDVKAVGNYKVDDVEVDLTSGI